MADEALPPVHAAGDGDAPAAHPPAATDLPPAEGAVEGEATEPAAMAPEAAIEEPAAASEPAEAAPALETEATAAAREAAEADESADIPAVPQPAELSQPAAPEVDGGPKVAPEEVAAELVGEEAGAVAGMGASLDSLPAAVDSSLDSLGPAERMQGSVELEVQDADAEDGPTPAPSQTAEVVLAAEGALEAGSLPAEAEADLEAEAAAAAEGELPPPPTDAWTAEVAPRPASAMSAGLPSGSTRTPPLRSSREGSAGPLDLPPLEQEPKGPAVEAEAEAEGVSASEGDSRPVTSQSRRTDSSAKSGDSGVRKSKVRKSSKREPEAFKKKEPAPLPGPPSPSRGSSMHSEAPRASAALSMGEAAASATFTNTGWGDEEQDNGVGASGFEVAASEDADTQFFAETAARNAELAGAGAGPFIPMEGNHGAVQELTGMFEKILERERKSGTDVDDGLDRETAVESLLQSLEASLLEQPARIRAAAGAEEARQETFREVLDELREVGPEKLTAADLLSCLGLGGPKRALAQAGRGWEPGDDSADGAAGRPPLSKADKARMKEYQLQEEALLQELQAELSAELDGAAKLVVVGGNGAAEKKRSVFRTWPALWEAWKVESKANMATNERERFEAVVGAEYMLNDLSVLDLGSLHWSCPETVGALAPARMYHSTCCQPTRIQAMPVVSQSVPSEGMRRAQEAQMCGTTDPFLYSGAVHLGHLFKHAAAMLDPALVVERGETQLGKVLMDSLLNSWHRAMQPQYGADGYIPATFVEEFLNMLMYPGSIFEDEFQEYLKQHASHRPSSKAAAAEAALLETAAASRQRSSGSVGSAPLAEVAEAAPTRAALLLAKLDALYPPRVDDGARPFKPLRSMLMHDGVLLGRLHAMVAEAAARNPGSPAELVVRVDRVETTDTFAAKVDALWLVVGLDAAPHLAARSSKVSVDCPRGDPARPKPFTQRMDFESVFHTEATESTSPAEEQQNPSVMTAVEEPPPPDDGVFPPPPEDAHEEPPDSPGAPLPPVNQAAEALALITDTPPPELWKILETILKQHDSPMLQVVVKGTQRAAAGVETELEVEIGRVSINLHDVLEGGIDLFAEWFDLTFEGEKVGRAQLSVAAMQVLCMVGHSAKKAYMDAFKLWVFGGRHDAAAAEGLTEAAPRDAKKLHHLAITNSLAVYNAAVNRWEEPATHGNMPEARHMHTAVVVRNHMVVYGGSNGAVSLGAVEVLDLEKYLWRQHALLETAPHPRHLHTANLLSGWGPDANEQLMVVFGGRYTALNADRPLGDVALLDLADPTAPVWRTPVMREGYGDAPAPRWGHASASRRDASGKGWTVYYFGGRVVRPEVERPSAVLQEHGHLGMRLDNSVWVLHVKPDKKYHKEVMCTWECLRIDSHSRLPAPREGTQMVAVGNKLVMMHGWIGAEKAPWVRDFWMLDLKSKKWVSLVFQDHFPSGRFGFSLALVDFRQSVPMCATVAGPELVKSRTEKGKMMLEAAAGAPSRLTLYARDLRGALVFRCGDNYIVRLLPKPKGVLPYVGLPVEQHGHCVDQGDGTYLVEFTPVVEGQYLLEITDTRANHIAGSPFAVEVGPGPSLTAMCVATGPGLYGCVAGAVQTFTLDTRDAFGNRAKPLEENFRLSLTGPRVNGRITDIKVNCKRKYDDGTWHCSYTVTLAGIYRLTLLVNGYAVQGSPFLVIAQPGPLSIGHCNCKGQGLAGDWHVGNMCTFTIQSRDRYRNKIRHGGAEFTVRVMTFNREGVLQLEVRGKVQDLGNGAYQVTYVPESVGMVTVTVNCKEEKEDGTVAYKPVLGSPFELIMNPDYMLPEMTTATGHGCEGQLVAGEPTEFTINAKDRFGNRLITGGDIFKCEIRCPHDTKIHPEVIDNDDNSGTYTVHYTPIYSGPHEIVIIATEQNPTLRTRNRRQQIQHGDPIIVNCIAADTLARCCTATGDGAIGITVARRPTSFLITARDRFGNPRPVGGDVFAVEMYAGWQLDISIMDNSDGTYLVDYNAGEEDEYNGPTSYTIFVTLGGEHICGSPFNHTVVPLITYAPTTEAVAVPNLLTAGEAAEFLLIAKDTEGRLCTRGLDNFRLEFAGLMGRSEEFESVWGDIKDLKDGKYMVRLVAEQSGYYKMSLRITLEGEDIAGSPFTITVVPSGLFNIGFWNSTFRMVDEKTIRQCEMKGPGIEDAVAGEKAKFMITSKVVQGEEIPGALFSVELRGPEFITGSVEGPIDGTLYHAAYCATVAGEYTATVKVGRFALPGCPFNVTVRPDETDPEQCVATGDGVATCMECKEASFVLTTHDMHGNRTNHSYDRFTVGFKGGGRVGRGKGSKYKLTEFEGKVKDNLDGSYTVTYITPFPGAFSMSIMHAVSEEGPWENIAGSPFQVQCAQNPRRRQMLVEEEGLYVINRELEHRLGKQLAAESITAAAAAKLHQTNTKPKGFVGGTKRKTGLAALFSTKPPEEEATAEEALALPPAASDVIVQAAGVVPAATLKSSMRRPTKHVELDNSVLKKGISVFGLGFWGQGAATGGRATLADDEPAAKRTPGIRIQHTEPELIEIDDED